LAAFTQDSARRWVSSISLILLYYCIIVVTKNYFLKQVHSLRLGIISAPRSRSNTRLGEFDVIEGVTEPTTATVAAKMPGQPLYYNDRIRLFTKSGYDKSKSSY
jgi:hypothetical protein